MAGGKTIPWRRDLLDMFAFHLDIPPGVTSLDVRLRFSAFGTSAPAFPPGASSTAFLNVLSWNQVVLYPQGYAAKDLTYVPSLKLPAGWKFGTALPGAKQNGDTIDFAPVPLSTLVDSPVLAGRYFRVIQLTPGQNPSHEIDIAADSAAALAMPPETEAHYRQLDRRDRRALRRAPLSRLPFPAHAQRRRGALRPRTSRIERRSHLREQR